MRFNILVLMFAAAPFLAAAENSIATNPADERIAATQKALHSNPLSPDPHIDLAAEYCRKARDSEETRYYDLAETELENALKIAPGSYDAQKLKVTVLLGRNELDAALKLATDLNQRVPDDIALWGLLAEINAALGNYKEALRDAQWVLDLRPGSTLGFREAARLREAYGDPEGAIEFYEEARRRTPQSDAEERAWLLTQVANLTAQTGDKQRAATLFEEARKLSPGSQLAVAGLARLRMAAACKTAPSESAACQTELPRQ
jgi:tetratricopeptide (TPR) repeat protein